MLVLGFIVFGFLNWLITGLISVYGQPDLAQTVVSQPRTRKRSSILLDKVSFCQTPIRRLNVRFPENLCKRPQAHCFAYPAGEEPQRLTEFLRSWRCNSCNGSGMVLNGAHSAEPVWTYGYHHSQPTTAQTSRAKGGERSMRHCAATKAGSPSPMYCSRQATKSC